MAQARLNLASIRNHARDITETETVDVSDSLLNLFIRDGYNRILDLERRWDFLEISFDMSTTAGQQSYTIDDFTDSDVREVISIVDPLNDRLIPVSYDLAEEDYIADTGLSGRPIHVAWWGGQIHLFPTPNESIVLKVRAYREPEDWITSSGTVDGPDGFDMCLVYYAASRIYQKQEDASMAQLYERSFNDGVSLMRRDVMRPNAYSPIVLSGGAATRKWGPRYTS